MDGEKLWPKLFFFFVSPCHNKCDKLKLLESAVHILATVCREKEIVEWNMISAFWHVSMLWANFPETDTTTSATWSFTYKWQNKKRAANWRSCRIPDPCHWFGLWHLSAGSRFRFPIAIAIHNQRANANAFGESSFLIATFSFYELLSFRLLVFLNFYMFMFMSFILRVTKDKNDGVTSFGAHLIELHAWCHRKMLKCPLKWVPQKVRRHSGNQ